MTLQILAVCTGNICRSPIVAQVLGELLNERGIQTASAGTRARAGAPMTPQAAERALAMGAPPRAVLAHKARALTREEVRASNLQLVMTRQHRRAVVEVEPAALRTTFTLREFERLADGVGDEQLIAAMAAVSADAEDQLMRLRLSRALFVLSSLRGVSGLPSSPESDDVIDPYRQSDAIYDLSVQQMVPALRSVVRVLNLVAGPR